LPLFIITGIVLPQRRIAEERQRAEEALARARLEQEQAAQRHRADAEKAADWVAKLRAAEQARDEALEQRDKAKSNAKRADEALREADRRRQEQADLREQADVATKITEQGRLEVLKQRAEVEGRLARLYSGQGARLMENGELLESLLWSVEALRLESDANRQAAKRLRLSAILSQCPRAVQTWFHDQPFVGAALSPDSRRALGVCKDGKAFLWDVTTGKAVGEPMAHAGGVIHFQFSADGKHMLTTATDLSGEP
jgi:hypothetical protein